MPLKEMKCKGDLQNAVVHLDKYCLVSHNVTRHIDDMRNFGNYILWM